MDTEKEERLMRFAQMHEQARHQSGKSQEFMAHELNVSIKTVRNWEKGISSPTFFQSLEWFNVLKINPFLHYLTVLFPDIFKKMKGLATEDETIEKAFEVMMQNISIEDKRALLYIFVGNHGGSAHSLLQLMLAYLHLPLNMRLSPATVTVDLFELQKEIDALICTENIMPDLDDLRHAIKLARFAVVNKEYGYSVIDKNKK